MAISPSDQGYFTSKGTVRTDAFTQRRSASGAGTNDIDEAVKQTARSATAAGIAETAAVKVSTRMNVGGTGFDAGVSSMVQQAISAGQSRKAGTQAARGAADSSTETSAGASGTSSEAAPVRRPIGGRYQNQILQSERQEQGKAAAATPAEAEETPAARRPVGGSYQNRILQEERERQASASGKQAAGDSAPQPQTPQGVDTVA